MNQLQLINKKKKKNLSSGGSCQKAEKLWNMKMMGILVVIGTLGIVSKGLEKKLPKLETRGRIKTIQTIALLKSARILRRILETLGNLLSLRCL